MLKQRVITALVLIALLLPALFAASIRPFAILTLIAFAAAGWEWARLNDAGGLAVALGIVLACAGAFALFADLTSSMPVAAWWIAAAVWILGGVWVLRRGIAVWPQLPASLRCLVGLVLLLTAWLALVHAKTIGVDFVLSVFCLVWIADIAAYFGGRAFGRRKLAPTISPGKSWEGAWSGMAGALLLAVGWLAAERALGIDPHSLYAVLRTRFGTFGMGLAVILLAAVSVVGDLFESLVKRSAGAKDSSKLLPGHGGILDRVDGLLPVFPIALALVML